MKQHMHRVKFHRTDFLFSNMSFLGGIGSALNIAGNYYKYNASPTEAEADANAIESDWGTIGKDIEETVKKNPTASFKLSMHR